MKRGKEDRISNLPDSIIHHILSFMYTKDAVQTCILSRRWRYIWISMPVLKLDLNCHYNEESYDGDTDEEMTQATKRFVKFVNKVLNLHDDSDIHVFHLQCRLTFMNVSKIYRWITAAVRHNVQELHIETNPEFGFEIPPCLCTCESLTKMELKLTGWEDINYEKNIILPPEMSLPRLKSLFLQLEDISFGDEKLTNRFFSSFPSLESLVMEIGYFGSHNMNLYISLPKLEHFKFDSENDETDCHNVSNSEVILHAPSLTSFTLNSYMSTSFTLENLSSLVTADIKIHVNSKDRAPGTYHDIHADKKEFYAQQTMRLLRGIHNVKVLMLDDSFLEALGGAPDILIDTQQPKFYNLQHWELETCLSKDCLHSIFYILQNSPNVESVTLQLHSNKHPVYPYCDKVNFNSQNAGDYWEAGLSLPCMLYHLKVVEINGLLGCVNEVKFLEILLKHAIILEKVVLASYFTKKRHALREKRMKIFSEMLLKFPRASKNIIILFKF